MRHSLTSLASIIAALLCLPVLEDCGGHTPRGILEREMDSFSLRVLPESYLYGGTAHYFDVASYQERDVTVVEVHVAQARGLKAFYCELTSPAGSLDCISIQPSARFGAGGQVLSLAVPDQRISSRLYFGMVIANCERRTGFSGSGLLATLRLRAAAAIPAPRAASEAPHSVFSRAALTLNIGELTWLYYNQGDYDQNGEVNISDLTPLGMHFGETGPFNPATALSCVDGDNNGELNLADITPIAVNFGHRVSGFHVYYSASTSDYPTSSSDPNGPGAALIADVTFSSSSSPISDRKRYYRSIPAPQPTDSHWVRPHDGEVEGMPSNGVSPGGFWRAYTVLTDVPNDGNGIYLDLAMIDGRPAIAINRGANLCYVRANDEHGETWPASVQLNAPIVDYYRDVSLADINGKPAVATINRQYDDCCCWYQSALDAGGVIWRSAYELNLSEVMYMIDVGEVANHPVVAYDIETMWGYQVIYQRAADEDGTNWGGGEAFALPSNVYSPSLAIIAGKPALAYSRGATPGELCFVTSADAVGAAWNAAVTLVLGEGTYQTGWSPALAVVNGHPAVCYEYRHDEQLRRPMYLRASDATGTVPWNAPTPTAIDERSPIDSGHSCSMAEVNGRVYVAYYDWSNSDLLCSCSTDANGENWLLPKVVDGDFGWCCSIADINGHPAIAYHNLAENALKYAIAY